MAVTSKTRRHIGRITPRLNKGVPMKELIEQGIEPQDYWDDWKDYRDGFRGKGDKKYLRYSYSWLGRHLDFKRWNS